MSVASLSNYFGSLSSGVKLGLAAGAVGLAAFAGWYFWPDREDTLKDWSEDYNQLCYGSSFQSEFNDINAVSRRASRILATVNDTGPAGERAYSQAITDDIVFCFGERYDEEGGAFTYNKWVNVYFFDDETIDEDIAKYLYSRAINDYWRGAVSRDSHYITGHALLWSRSTQAAFKVAYLDAVYDIYGGNQAFDMEQWQDLEGNAKWAAPAAAFRGALESGGYINDARLAAFKATLTDHDAIYDSDEAFLSWYKNEVDEDVYMQTISCGQNCTMTVPMADPPSSWVHSEEMDPDTLVTLSKMFTDGGPYISREDAQEIIDNKDNYTPTAYRTQMLYNKALNNAERHTRDHYTEGNMQYGRGLNMDMLPN